MSIEPGIYPDMSIEDYHASDAMSKSGLDYLKKSVSHYLHYRKFGSKSTNAKTLGDAIHCAVLEPEIFQTAYIDSKPPVIFGNWRHATTAALASKGMTIGQIADDVGVKPDTVAGYLEMDDVVEMIAHYEKYPPGSVPDISDDDLETAKRAAGDALEHPGVREILEGARFEQSAFWECPDTGILCRCRPDIESSGLLADIKSTRDASPMGFAKEIGKYRYHVQDAWYSWGWQIASGYDVHDFLIVAIETTPAWQDGKLTHPITIHRISADSQQRGLSYALEELQRFAEWKAGKAMGAEPWAGYPQGIIDTDAPAWA